MELFGVNMFSYLEVVSHLNEKSLLRLAYVAVSNLWGVSDLVCLRLLFHIVFVCFCDVMAQGYSG